MSTSGLASVSGPDLVGDSEWCKALGDPVRWRIVELLASEELCVCHLTEELGLSQPLVSHHLKALRRAGLVDWERHSYWTYYRLRRPALAVLSRRLSDLATDSTGSAGRKRPCC